MCPPCNDPRSEENGYIWAERGDRRRKPDHLHGHTRNRRQVGKHDREHHPAHMATPQPAV